MRYSLRSLFTIVTVIAIGLASVLWLTRDYRARLAIRAELLALGARFADVRVDRSIQVLFTESVDGKQLAKYREIKLLEFQGLALTSSSFRSIAGLQRIDALMLQSCRLDEPGDLAVLKEVGAIRSLLIWSTPIDDTSLDLIADLPGLEMASFSGTQVTPAGIERLRAKRPGLRIDVRP